jgi:hypothetical protein
VQLGRAGVRVLAQHAQQPAHLGQRGAGSVTDRRQPLRPGGRHPRGGQPRRLGLDRDHRDVVGHHVVQLVGDPGPLPASRVLEQRPDDDLSRGIARGRLGSRPLSRAGPGCRWCQYREQHHEDLQLAGRRT